MRARRSCSASGKHFTRWAQLGIVDPRAETILFRLGQSPSHPFDPLRRLPFAEDHFREAAAGLAFEVDLREAEVRRPLQFTQGSGDVDLTGLNAFEKGLKLCRRHGVPGVRGRSRNGPFSIV